MPAIAPTPSFSDTFFRVVPAFDSLRNYRWTDGRADLLAGLSVAAVALPQALAYGMVAGVPPQHAVYTAIVMTTIGALFDSSKQLINGPTNAISIAVLSALAVVAVPEQRLAAAVLLAFMIGTIQLGITFLRLGDLTRYISHSVIVGFTLGAGSLLVFDQLKNLLGMKSMGGVHDHFLLRFWLSMTQGGGVHLPTAAVGLGTMVLVLLMRWGKKKTGWTLFPEFLVGTLLMSMVVAFLGLESQGVKVVGDIPKSLPHFQLPHFDASLMRELSGSALAVAVLGLLEAIAMAKAIAAVTRQKLDINQQCLSEGLANMGAGLFQCIPGSGSLTRSAINQQAGARTQWSGVISALAIAVVVMLFAPYARFIPKAALAGLLMVVSYRMVDWGSLAYHWRASRFDAIIVATTALSAVLISVEFCVLIGVFMSFLLAVPRAGKMLLTEFVLTEEGGVHERLQGEANCPQMLIFGLEGEMFFGAGSALEAHLDRISEQAERGARVVVLRVKRVRSPDAVCMHLLEMFLERMKKAEVEVLLCGVRDDLHEALERTGLLRGHHAPQVFREQPVRNSATLQAIRHGYTLIQTRCENCPRREGHPHLYYAV